MSEIRTDPSVMTDDQIEREFLRLADDIERNASRLARLGDEMVRRMGH